MTKSLTKPKAIRRALATLTVLVTLIAAGLVAYSIHLEHSAKDLIDSVCQVRSREDAERVIESWRKRSGERSWQESDHPGGDHDFDAQIDNTPVWRLHISEPTILTVGFTMRGPELRSVVVIMTTGRGPAPTSSVWVQEWFQADSPNRVHVVAKDKPWKAAVDFPAGIAENQRQKAFALNANCLIRLGGCKSAEELLSGVWQLDAGPGGVSF